MNNLLSSVEPSEIECVSQQIIVKQDCDEYQEYFDYFVKVSMLKPPLPGKREFSPSICVPIQAKETLLDYFRPLNKLDNLSTILRTCISKMS